MKTFLKIFYLLPVIVVVGVVGYLVSARSKVPAVHVMSGTPFATTPITNLTARLFTSEAHLGPAQNDVFFEFRDAGGKLVDVGQVEFEMRLAGSASVMHSISKVLPTSTPGQYRAVVQPQLAAEWKAELSINGPAGQAKASFPVIVK